MIAALRALTEEHEGSVAFRAVCAWRSKYDTAPESYFALNLDIAGNKFIIDLKEMHQSLNITDNRDVFTENEWLMMYKRSPPAFELIKYKDFDYIDNAQYFIYREATSPTAVLSNGFLLKEPAWYKPALLEGMHLKHKRTDTSIHAEANDFRYAARALRMEFTTQASQEHFPIAVLLKCNKLDEIGARQLIRMLASAKETNLNSQAFLINRQRLSSTESLTSVNEGILVGIYDTSSCLKHLLLSVGHGRFLGVGNSFFDPALPDRVSLIIAEQMGTFKHGLFKLRHNEQNFFVIVGKAFGSSMNIPTLLNDVPMEKIPVYFSDGRQRGYREQLVAREKLLLGKDCHIDVFKDVKTRLRIKLHGAPFNVNNMDAFEFSDIIRGLPFLQNATFSLQDLDRIELFSCYSGYGGRYATAQILADELGVPIKAYPFKVTDELQIRRPEWFISFTPDERRWRATGGVNERYLAHFDGAKYLHTQRIHRRLHDVIKFVLRIAQRFSGQQGTHDEQPVQEETALSRDLVGGTQPINTITDVWRIPLIFADIVHLLYNKNPVINHRLGDIELSEASRQVLDDILADYNLMVEEEHSIIEQAFLDLILSIEEFNYLTRWFNADAESAGTATSTSTAAYAP
ncbi:hypothetical protein ABK905_14520 [Acerihabitans sp. KWT182]|uniref:Uncharacterized protein n=1 Tax=Acerihabitans sp. KWT182 TaxID=3157919 RepID=A0AAU7Q4P4_9GAMM